MIEEIQAYVPFNVQEENDKKMILSFLQSYPDAFYRDNELGHMTASAWVVNHERNKVLMAYHKIYDSWAWLGGHCDGQEDCLAVAMKEVREESGVKSLRPLKEDIFSLEVLCVNAHYKNGKYVPSHLHFNVTYLLEADEKEKLSIKEDENSNVAWFGLDEALCMSDEKWFRDFIYSKLNEKLRILNENN
mgnify:CR=1 FL=1